MMDSIAENAAKADQPPVLSITSRQMPIANGMPKGSITAPDRATTKPTPNTAHGRMYFIDSPGAVLAAGQVYPKSINPSALTQTVDSQSGAGMRLCADGSRVVRHRQRRGSRPLGVDH